MTEKDASNIESFDEPPFLQVEVFSLHCAVLICLLRRSLSQLWRSNNSSKLS
jgi:hypothetical protein